MRKEEDSWVLRSLPFNEERRCFRGYESDELWGTDGEPAMEKQIVKGRVGLWLRLGLSVAELSVWSRARWYEAKMGVWSYKGTLELGPVNGISLRNSQELSIVLPIFLRLLASWVATESFVFGVCPSYNLLSSGKVTKSFPHTYTPVLWGDLLIFVYWHYISGIYHTKHTSLFMRVESSFSQLPG